MRARLAILLAGTVALGGCAYGYGDYGPYGGMSVGVGYDSGYGGYGYGGYGYGNPYGPYGGYGYPGYYGGFGDPYFGWYDNYYYPGTGYYVYDQYRRPHRWNQDQERYWTQRRERSMSAAQPGTTTSTATATPRPMPRDNWSGFSNRTERATAREERQQERQQERVLRRDDTLPTRPHQ